MSPAETPPIATQPPGRKPYARPACAVHRTIEALGDRMPALVPLAQQLVARQRADNPSA